MFWLFWFCLSKLLSEKDRASFDACASWAQSEYYKRNNGQCVWRQSQRFQVLLVGFLLASCHDFVTYMFERQMVQVLAGTEYTRVSIQTFHDYFLSRWWYHWVLTALKCFDTVSTFVHSTRSTRTMPSHRAFDTSTGGAKVRWRHV